MIVALSFYGMSTFEGPMMSLKEVNALSHYTDWTVGHVHSGALGWVAMISFGSLYHMIPKLWDTKMYSQKLIEWHFWLATIGIVLYIVSMWISGITQGLMWRSFDEFGNLEFSFAQSVAAMMPFYAMRAIGGMFFLTGAVLMLFNALMTIRQASQENAVLEAKLAAKLARA
jgi:cytochrome c oxidase cbb3-type subunit 1